jgi:2,5-diketo-D-gluconate reductase A
MLFRSPPFAAPLAALALVSSCLVHRPMTTPSLGYDVRPPPFLSLGHVTFRPGLTADGITSETVRLVKTWLRVGGVGIDTAVAYHNHQLIATALLQSGKERSDYYVLTKLWKTCDPKTAQGLALTQANRSVHELGLKYVDCILIHAPCPNSDANIAMWRGLQAAVRMGLTRSIGVSNFGGESLSTILELGEPRPVVNQIQISIGSYEKLAAVADVAKKGSVFLQAYSPLQHAIGALSNDTQVAKIAQRHGMSVAQVGLRWLIQMGIRVATSPGSEQHMKDTLAVLDPKFEFSAEEMQALFEVDLGRAECKAFRERLARLTG